MSGKTFYLRVHSHLLCLSTSAAVSHHRPLSHATQIINAVSLKLQETNSEFPGTTISQSFGSFIANADYNKLSSTVKQRSKRMMLDTLGVGLIGSTTEITKAVMQHVRDTSSSLNKQRGGGSSFWGSSDQRKVSPVAAAFVNGVAVHSMDFDDTWHPATHPSGPVLSSVVALAEALPDAQKPSGKDILLAYNVGIEIQGMLMRCSTGARDIPNRFHPPAVVGVMGSAAACAKLLGFGADKCLHTLAIATSFAGAPMANAGTKAKPLHVGNSARFGLEAALLAKADIQGDIDILEKESGFPAFFDDYSPSHVRNLQSGNIWCLDEQDIAIKRIPAHLAMHWTMDAAQKVRQTLVTECTAIDFDDISEILIAAPNSKYVNRPLPKNEHAARHSFQFIACSTILDGVITPESFSNENMSRVALRKLLNKTQIIIPSNNDPNFDKMYVDIAIKTHNNGIFTARCETFYGHWRNPLTDTDLQKKFKSNALACKLSESSSNRIIECVNKIENCDDETVKEMISNLTLV